METVYLILLFVAPGIFVRQLRHYLKASIKNDQPTYEYMLEIVLDSIVVVMITICLLYRNAHWNTLSLEQLMNKLMWFDNLIIFTLVVIVISVLWYFVKFKWIKPCMLKIKNIYLQKTEQIAHIDEPRVWEVLQAQDGVKNTWQVVSVFKDGDCITSGMITWFGSPQNSDMELILRHTEKVEELKNAHPEWFHVRYDYYNATNGLRIKVYKQSTIQEHWNEFFGESC